MSEDKNRDIVSGSGGGLLGNVILQVKLILRLMSDPRVSPLLKLLPVGSALYLIIPDLMLGPIDDVGVVWLGTYLFVELCPPEIVQEHLDALKQQPDIWNPPHPNTPQADPGQTQQGDVIEGEWREKK